MLRYLFKEATMFKLQSLFFTLFLGVLICFSCSGNASYKAGKERTLSIIKPDAVGNNHIGQIISRFEANGLKIVAIKMVQLDSNKAGKFYEAHKGKPFYNELVNFMSSGPVVIMVLEGDDAITKNREIMGATNPEQAKEGTIRKDFASSMGKNAVHGSDSPEAAKTEIEFFFAPNEIL